MSCSSRVFLAGVLAAIVSSVSPVRAASAADAAAGRELMKRYADSVVSVELVVTLKVKSGEREAPPREQRVEVNGTVISPSGLTVTSLARVDPQVEFEAMRATMGGRAPELVGIDFKEVKIRLADGKEIPARFVLKDADLDLAFMAPVGGEGAPVEFPSYVKLDAAAEGQLLGTYFFVSRAPKALQRVPLVRASEVMGVIEKPRRFYLLTDEALGSPIFDPSGKVLGITVQNFSGGRSNGLVVLPAADVAEMAKQAAEAQKTPPPADATSTAAPPANADEKKG
ncbi:MAG TPA: S1C family serine protease [Opitutaceae bacterium]|nr:S1C family serine protease [Opitutaceae bacterium]